MDNPLLVRITFKKALQIVDMLMSGMSGITVIADKLGVDKEVVELIKYYYKTGE